MGFLVFFCVRDVATRGQYLALSKALWSCYLSTQQLLATAQNEDIPFIHVGVNFLSLVGTERRVLEHRRQWELEHSERILHITVPTMHQ